MWVLSLSSHAVPFTSRLFFAKRCLVAWVSPVCLLIHPLKDSGIVYLGVKLLSVFTESFVCVNLGLCFFWVHTSEADCWLV